MSLSSGTRLGPARFKREAKAIAAHASADCTLFDVGHQDGTDYLVMEYLEGETLAQRLDATLVRGTPEKVRRSE